MEKHGYRFSFGPGTSIEGADPSGRRVASPSPSTRSWRMYKELGFDGVQFHDDDAVPDLDDLTPEQIARKAKAMRQQAGRATAWSPNSSPRACGRTRAPSTAATPQRPQGARLRHASAAKRSIDIANALGTNLIVLWLAREGTYIREAKDSKSAPTGSSKPST